MGQYLLFAYLELICSLNRYFAETAVVSMKESPELYLYSSQQNNNYESNY
jgi:hypothetical protein